jgi:hypothetical protein
MTAHECACSDADTKNKSLKRQYHNIFTMQRPYMGTFENVETNLIILRDLPEILERQCPITITA